MCKSRASTFKCPLNGEYMVCVCYENSKNMILWANSWFLKEFYRLMICLCFLYLTMFSPVDACKILLQNLPLHFITSLDYVDFWKTWVGFQNQIFWNNWFSILAWIIHQKYWFWKYHLDFKILFWIFTIYKENEKSHLHFRILLLIS